MNYYCKTCKRIHGLVNINNQSMFKVVKLFNETFVLLISLLLNYNQVRTGPKGRRKYPDGPFSGRLY